MKTLEVSKSFEDVNCLFFWVKKQISWFLTMAPVNTDKQLTPVYWNLKCLSWDKFIGCDY